MTKSRPSPSSRDRTVIVIARDRAGMTRSGQRAEPRLARLRIGPACVASPTQMSRFCGLHSRGSRSSWRRHRMFRYAEACSRTSNAGVYEFLHLAAASAVRWRTGQFPCRKTRAGALRLPPDRMAVAAERCMEYTALSKGCRARLARLTALGVTARFTARPGCIARRTLRGTNNLEKKPTRHPKRRNGYPKHYSCWVPAPLLAGRLSPRSANFAQTVSDSVAHPSPRRSAARVDPSLAALAALAAWCWFHVSPAVAANPQLIPSQEGSGAQEAAEA